MHEPEIILTFFYIIWRTLYVQTRKWCCIHFAVIHLYQGGSFSLINVGSGFYCLCSSSYLFTRTWRKKSLGTHTSFILFFAHLAWKVAWYPHLVHDFFSRTWREKSLGTHTSFIIFLLHLAWKVAWHPHVVHNFFHAPDVKSRLAPTPRSSHCTVTRTTQEACVKKP